jgi:shikimate 5-dehydrogenase
MQNLGATYVSLFNAVSQTGFVKEAQMSALQKALLLGAGGLGVGIGGGLGYGLARNSVDAAELKKARELARSLGYESGVQTAESAYEDALSQLANETPYGMYPGGGY